MNRKLFTETASSTAAGCPLDPHLSGFLDSLKQQGYRDPSLKSKVVIVNRFNRWLTSQDLILTNLDEQTVFSFFEEQPRPGHARRGDLAVLLTLTDHLRQAGVTPYSPSVSAASTWQCIMDSFAQYLREERGLSQTSVLTNTRLAHLFVFQITKDLIAAPNDICSRHIREFVCKMADSVNPRYAQLITSALRSFLRFLYIDGKTSCDLSLGVPTVAEWRLSTLPKFLDSSQVETMLAACGQSNEIQKRDYAILLLLARLGLRACEIRNMELNDIHWEIGQLTIRGKGGICNRMPIPYDVGEALAHYLVEGRPHCTTRKVFIRAKAPRQGFSSSAAVCDTVRRALSRAGLCPPRKGAHLLRHSLAVRMLDGGATMDEIAEVLRHCSHTTTEIYTKVDFNMLGTVVQPWPGGVV
jgi:site-specific recombinase XerD